MLTNVEVYVDPPVHQLTGDKLFDLESNAFSGDNINAPYVLMKERLNELGVEVHTTDFLPAHYTSSNKLVISFGVPDRLAALTLSKYQSWSSRPDVTLSAFFANECPIVEPSLYKCLPNFSRLFARTYSWSDTETLLPFTGKRVECEHFCWPQSFDQVHNELWENRERDFLVMINSNKLPRIYKDELYTERLKAVEYFNRFGEISLYGRGWGKPPMKLGKSLIPYFAMDIMYAARQRLDEIRPDPLYVAATQAFKGSPSSKSQTLGKYTFALCFENSVMKGWITEKLFDCFFTGTVPVYWGAPDIGEWVPGDCYIDMNEFDGFEALRTFLKGLDEGQIEAYRVAARNYLLSASFDPFRARTFADRIVDIVKADAAKTAVC